MTVNYPNQKQVSYGISKGVSVGMFPLHGVRDQLRAGCDVMANAFKVWAEESRNGAPADFQHTILAFMDHMGKHMFP